MSIYDFDTENVIGTIQEASSELYDELLTTGSSMLLSDVVKVFVMSTKKYVGWSGQLTTLPVDPMEAGSTVRPKLIINENTVISVGDWLIIEPVVRAHCDLVQAKRMEGAQGLGVNSTGMTTSEARGYYDEAIKQMQKEAFQAEPYTIETPQKSPYEIIEFNGFSTAHGRSNTTDNKVVKIAISNDANNILTVVNGGLFATVATPDDNSSFVDAFNAEIDKDG